MVATQAGGSVMIYHEGLALLCCATATREPREGIDFFPLMCDYEERFYAAGKFPGGFIKREGRPSDTAVLISRRIDRPIRPMFPDDFHNEVQIIVTALSPGQRAGAGCLRDQRRQLRPGDQQRPVAQPDRRRAPGLCRRQVRAQPHLPRAGAKQLEPAGRRDEGPDQHDRGREQGSLDRDHHRGPAHRASAHSRDHRPDRGAGRRARQAQDGLHRRRRAGRADRQACGRTGPAAHRADHPHHQQAGPVRRHPRR